MIAPSKANSGPVVQVLMSTHNGREYVREQIDSVLRQTGVRVRLLVRDDGSTDGTPEVLQSFEDDERVRIVSGRNLLLPWAFFHLLDESDDTADYWALADQDDVWLPDKLRRAVIVLGEVQEPGLYCARVLVVDAHLAPLYKHPLPRRGPSFANALVQNIATGCTIVVNRQARNVLRGRWPRYAVMHDAWLYLVVAGTGVVRYDPTIVVEYRQHTRNAVGMGRGRAARLLGRVRRQLRSAGAGAHGRQDAELLVTHGDTLTEDARQQLDELLAVRHSLRRRLWYAWQGPAHRQTRGSDLILKVLQVGGRV